MPIISGSIPKLTDGVSQQAVTLRLNTAMQDVQNAWLSVVTGSQKRPPTKIVKKLQTSIEGGNIATTIVDRFDGKKFIVVVKSGSIRVFDAYTGNEKTVYTPDGTTYLSSTSETDYGFVTVADTTFIVNKTTVVQTTTQTEDGSSRLDPDKWWSVFVKEAVPNSNYAIYINSLLQASYTTKTNVDASNVLERTSVIANDLKNDLAATSSPVGEVIGVSNSTILGNTSVSSSHGNRTYSLTGGSGTGAKAYVKEEAGKITYWRLSAGGSGYTVGNVLTLSGADSLGTHYLTVTGVSTGSPRTVYRNNSTITVQLAPGDKVGLDDGNGGQSMTAFGSEISNFSKLPPQDVENRLVRVQGEKGDSGDDYYVIYTNTLWRETYGYGMRSQFNALTMPHVLVYDSKTDTFTFKAHTWKDRLAGDDDTNPLPSFAGQTISAMALYRGRLVLLSGENVICSEADNYENFFRSTVVQLLDNEVIDIAAVTGRQANLFHSVQFNKSLLVFSDKSQFILDGGQVLSPKSASLVVASAYDCSKTVRPINMDRSVYFIEDSGTYAKLYEYMIGQDGTTEQADLSSIQVPEYIAGPVKALVGVPKASAIFILGQDTKALYVYKYMDGPQGKLQSAWNRWTFRYDIKAMVVSGSTLYLFQNRADGLYLTSINIEDDAVRSTADLMSYLDSQIPLSSCTRSYNATTGKTTITLPYEYDTSLVKIVKTSGSAMVGFYPTITVSNSTTVVVDGDWTGVTGYVGETYIFSLTFSPFVLREAKGNATSTIQDGLLSIRYMSVNYEDTSYFKVSVRNKGAVPQYYSGTDPKLEDFTGFVFGELSTTIGTVPLASGEYRFPVFEDGRYVEITITNDSPFHSCLSSAEWFGQWTPKAKQRF